MNTSWRERFRKEYREAYTGILSEEVLAKGNPWFENFIQQTLDEERAMLREGLQRVTKQVSESAPEGDWYLLPPGAHNVVGYLTAEGIGEIAYKGKPMNISAVIEETISQVSLSLLQDKGNEETPR